MLRKLRTWGGFVVRSRLRAAALRFKLATADCRAAQRQALERILSLNQGSDFSRRHGLWPGMSTSELRRSVPITDFEFFRPYVERLKAGESSALLGPQNKLLMFTLSSGTTAESKYIPITAPFLEDYRRGWQTWGISAFDDHPRVFELDIVQLASDYDQFRTSAGIPCGNISGLVSAMQRPIVRLMYAIPQAVSKIKDPEAKYYVALRAALANRHIGLIMTANASTLIQLASLADREREALIRDIHNGGLSANVPLSQSDRERMSHSFRRGNRRRAAELEAVVERTGHLYPQHAWPDLSLAAVWTGGSAGFYLPAMRRYFGDVPVRDHGLSASEGRMTIPFADDSPAGTLDTITHYFEFVPESECQSEQPTVLEAHELSPGENYYILLTTTSGLYRYNIRDVVRCVGFSGTTPVLEFLHKGAHISNLTGEKISESQVVSAVRETTQRLRFDMGSFTVSPVWGEPPFYRLHLELHRFADRELTARLAAQVDEHLQGLNCEYREKRKSGRLAAMEPLALPLGTWHRFARERQTRVGGSVEQYKHPCLVPDVNFTERLLREFVPAEGITDERAVA